jgi:hypothetical protein
MTKPKRGAVSVARREPRTRTSLLLESIALRHQIAVLERSRTRRPASAALIPVLDLAVALVVGLDQ